MNFNTYTKSFSFCVSNKSALFKVSKGAKIGNRCNQAPHLTQDIKPSDKSPNPYKHSVHFVGHRQTVQTQTDVWSGSPLFACRIFNKYFNKMKYTTQNPSWALIDDFPCLRLRTVNPLFTSNSWMHTLANNEDLDEMQHSAAFYQGLHRLLRYKGSSEKEIILCADSSSYPRISMFLHNWIMPLVPYTLYKNKIEYSL